MGFDGCVRNSKPIDSVGFFVAYFYIMAERNVAEKAQRKNGIERGFGFKNRKPAYLAAGVILIGLLFIYLLSVYHNKHENKSPLPPKTMTKPEQ